MANTTRSRSTIIAAVAGLLILHAVLALWSATKRSVTVDELFHVTGGYCYNKFGDYRMQPDNGVLPQRLHALPAILMGAKSPSTAGNEYWGRTDIYVWGYQFFYESGNDHWPLLMGARAVNLCFTLGICALVFAWARRLGGNVAGFAALTLAALSPTLLAHGPMATTDAAAAFFISASATAFWWQLRERGGAKLLLSAVAFGLACVAKFSAVLLLPIFVVLIVAHFATAPREQRRWGFLAFSLAAHAVVGCVIIWACFGFRYSAFMAGSPSSQPFIMTWEVALQEMGWQAPVILWMRAHHIFPEAFLFGYSHTYFGSLRRAAFLAGEYGVTGWRSFFPLAFLWKSTPAELAAVGLCLVALVRHWRRVGAWALKLAPLAAVGGVYGTVAVLSHLNIGHRHLLPIYPALFVALGLATAALGATRQWLVAGVLAAAQFFSSASIFPYYLAYFNALAGGPANGWRLLVDSSLDWGQDLSGLKTWLDKNNSGPNGQTVYLSYFGAAEPRYYGIRAERLLFIDGFKLPARWVNPQGGLYCISATSLQAVYSPARGPWTLDYEKEYQDLLRLEPQFRAFFLEPESKERLLAAAPLERWQTAWKRYDILRHARLCAYLRARGPDATVGYSILIFRVTDAELDAVLRSSYSAWQSAIAQAASKRRP